MQNGHFLISVCSRKHISDRSGYIIIFVPKRAEFGMELTPELKRFRMPKYNQIEDELTLHLKHVEVNSSHSPSLIQ